MSISTLRNYLKNDAAAKDATRAAGAGIWGEYVRTMMASEPTEQSFDDLHKTLVQGLEELEPLAKNEKNSLTSAKSVLKKAIIAAKDVWQRDADGNILQCADGNLPKGKNELQDAAPWFDVLSKRLTGVLKTASAEDSEPLDAERRAAVAVQLSAIMGALGMGAE